VVVLNILIVLAAFSFMEVVAWATHKYIMHGVLWKIHKDHHTKSPGLLEYNDWFLLIFAIPSWLLIMIGLLVGFVSLVWVGVGVALYGLSYFVVHDIFIHQRIKMLKKTNNRYLKAVRKAHKVHHKHLSKDSGECYGMLVVPFKYIKEAFRTQKTKKEASS